MLARGVAFALWVLIAFAPAYAEVQVPPLQARVTDLTQTLSVEQQRALEQKLAALESEKGSQIALLIVPTTQPEVIEQYAMRVAEQWKIGRKGIDDGVIVLVAMQDRTLRIEVGYGLEGVIPDATAKRIIDEIMVPRFKTGDAYGGIDQGMDALIGLIKGEPLPAPRVEPSPDPGMVQQIGDALPLIFVFVFVVGGMLRAIFGRLVGAGIAATIAGIGIWLLVSSLIAASIAGFIVFLITLSGLNTGAHGGGGRGGGGGFGGGGFSGGGGGFSGGGGGFGGGGASGRW